MAGLVPAIHNRDLEWLSQIGIMDGRHEGGHDDDDRFSSASLRESSFFLHPSTALRRLRLAGGQSFFMS
jgi:hypothetical protein